MAIDPRLYEKLSGRKGDPMDRLGAVSVQNETRKSQRESAPKGFAGGLGSYWKYRAMISIIGALILAVGFFITWLVK